MTGIYGHKWGTTYGLEVSETWVRGLRGVSGEDLARGLRACLDWDENEGWPPTLQQFRALCVPAKKAAAHDIFPGLPKPPLTDEERAGIDSDILRLREETARTLREQEREFNERRWHRAADDEVTA